MKGFFFFDSVSFIFYLIFSPPSVLGLLDFSLASSLPHSLPPRLPHSLTSASPLPAQEIVSPTRRPKSSLPCVWRPPAQEIVSPPLLYAPAEVHPPVCLAASCARNSKALKKNFLRASRGKRGWGSLEVLVIFSLVAQPGRNVFQMRLELV